MLASGSGTCIGQRVLNRSSWTCIEQKRRTLGLKDLDDILGVGSDARFDAKVGACVKNGLSWNVEQTSH